VATSAGLHHRFSSPSSLALVGGVLAFVAIALTFSCRARDASAREVVDAIRSRIYTPIEQAQGQARSLASSAEVREGLAERNRVRLTRALRQAVPQMSLTYAGVLLPDGTPYFWFPDVERSRPIIATRIPIEYELRPVGVMEYGVMLTDDFLQELRGVLATDIRLVESVTSGEHLASSSASDDVVATSEVAARATGGGSVRAYLRTPGDRSGPVVAALEFRLPLDSPAAARIRGQRNLLWTVVAATVLGVAVYDARLRRRRLRPSPGFTPIPNPYIVGNPIRTPEMFFGREDDFQFARQKLTGERAGLVLVFCGERRSGKTSMLFQILSGRLGPAFVPVLIDMQYFAAIARDQDFYESVVREIVRGVYPEAEQKERQKRYYLPSDSAAQSFEIVLDEAMAAHPDKTFLFLFDEYEILEAKIDRRELSPMVIPYLAGLLERKRRISFIFTGSRTLEERPTAHWRVMLGKSQYRKISYLTPADTERLITRPVSARVKYETEAIATISRLTSGQPFYTQVICQNLVDHLNEGRREIVTVADVSTIVDAIVDNPLPQMIYFWDSLPVEQKVALSLLAEALAADASWGAADQVLADAASRSVPVAMEIATLESAFERLFETELLVKSADRRFRYRVDLLRHWIRRSHSIWQVVKEVRSEPHARI
jgi:hypothetical protein